MTTLTTATKPSDYKGIELWGRLLGSRTYFIEMEQEAALRDHAPIDAVYRSNGGTGPWVCVSNLRPGHHFIEDYQRFINQD